MKKIALIFTVLFALNISVNAQISITSYSIHAIALNTSKSKKISTELKAFFNRKPESSLFEIAGMYNFSKKAYHQFSAGLGLNIVPFTGPDIFNSLTIPLQLEIFPLQNFKQLSVIFEVTPEIYVENGSNIRQMWGLRYAFGKK
jgi:hypothetical protein